MAPPLPEGCPWSGWTPPNLKWCEENLCGWITTPANTWSNLAYLFVGILIIRECRGKPGDLRRMFGPITLFLGAASFLYHASYTWFFQFFDFVGMFLVIILMITLNLRRLDWIHPGNQNRVFWGGCASPGRAGWKPRANSVSTPTMRTGACFYSPPPGVLVVKTPLAAGVWLESSVRATVALAFVSHGLPGEVFPTTTASSKPLRASPLRR